MGKRAHVILPYSLCGLLGVVLLGVVLWPRDGRGHERIDQMQIPRRAKREQDDVSSYSHYTGAAGGGYFGHAGAPTNIQCMPRSPTWGKHNDQFFGTKGTQAYMYGVEYKTQPDDFPFSHENAEAVLNHNLPCAVCMSTIRGSQIMVPGRKDCLPGWHVEYSGYLMSGDFQQAGASQFVCVDKDPEADPAGYRSESSHQLVVVEGQCGSLPCPPYVSGREITCSVCTK